MNDFRQLEIYQEAVELVGLGYRVSEENPGSERFGLSPQIRRAAISVTSNTAEGAGRGRPREMARYLEMALGSLSELDSQLEVAIYLGMARRAQEVIDRIEPLRAKTLGLHDRLMGTR